LRAGRKVSVPYGKFISRDLVLTASAIGLCWLVSVPYGKFISRDVRGQFDRHTCGWQIEVSVPYGKFISRDCKLE